MCRLNLGLLQIYIINLFKKKLEMFAPDAEALRIRIVFPLYLKSCEWRGCFLFCFFLTALFGECCMLFLVVAVTAQSDRSMKPPPSLSVASLCSRSAVEHRGSVGFSSVAGCSRCLEAAASAAWVGLICVLVPGLCSTLLLVWREGDTMSHFVLKSWGEKDVCELGDLTHD